jgi:hypothetical protein
MTSIIKVNNLQNQCGANIISESSNTITIGASGDTVTLAAGASQSGFGRSGSVNWDTTKKTTGFTAVSGNGYFCDTTSAAFIVTLPATPAAGDIVAIADYANTAATNNITVGRNSVNIDGEAVDAKIKVNGQVYTLVYVDATEGWKTVGQTFNQITTAEFVAATGGTITTCGNYKIHTFTGPGTFTVTNAGNPAGSSTVDYMIVAGGGGGGYDRGGGGGGGGFRESVPSPAAWTASPLANPGGALPVSVQGYPITVGGGGPGGTSPISSAGNTGNPSVFSTITSTAGGGGANANYSGPDPTILGTGQPGGSGGGGTGSGPSQGNNKGTGNTPPVAPPQGNNGGPGFDTCRSAGGGGGGAIAVGEPAGATYAAGDGGIGATTSISGSAIKYAGGGGGGNQGPLGGSFGFGGIFPGGSGPAPQTDRFGAGNGGNSNGTSGTANTGGGGGGGGSPSAPLAGGSGGSGIVIIRYKFQ